MWYRTDDPIADFLAYDAEQYNQLQKLPKCSECNERIQDDFLYEINGELICEDCLNSNYRKLVEDYVE